MNTTEQDIDSRRNAWRVAAWITSSLVAFPILVLAAAFVASRLTAELGIADPEREHFALVAATLLTQALLATVPPLGFLLRLARTAWPGLVAIVLFALAAILNYLVFEDSRSGHYFDTDHALPALFVPIAIALLATAELGRHVAVLAPARRAWEWVSAGTGLLVIGLVIITFQRNVGDAGGMDRIDQPLTVITLVFAAACALPPVARPVIRDAA